MNVEWSKAALADLERFAEFLEKHFPTLSPMVGPELLEAAERLGANPQLGRVHPKRPRFRQAVLRILKADYVFEYQIRQNRVIIVRVFHGRENRP
jgi:plasmid stabilization system protein ParE